MAKEKNLLEFKAEFFFGFDSKWLKIKDNVITRIEEDKLACYEDKGSITGRDNGTTLLKIALKRVNGIILAKPSEIIELAKKEAQGDELAGNNIKDAADWLAANVSGYGKVVLLNYKGGKDRPMNVVLHPSMMNEKKVRTFIEAMQQQQAKVINNK